VTSLNTYGDKLALFGSVLTHLFGPDSDIGVLFEYDPDHVPSLFDVAEMEEELSAPLGRKADMRTPRGSSVLLEPGRVCVRRMTSLKFPAQSRTPRSCLRNAA